MGIDGRSGPVLTFTDMSYEVEVKYRTTDHSALVEKLTILGAVPAGAISQGDVYLSHPARDFARTNEALRIRRVGDSNRLTYKGSKQPGPTKTREEIEVPCGEGPGAFEQVARLFENLGFRPVAVIRKFRRPFHLSYQGRDLEVVLDEAEGLGLFAEVEAIARDQDDLPAAQDAVLKLAAALGLTEVEPRSYLRMSLEIRG